MNTVLFPLKVSRPVTDRATICGGFDVSPHNLTYIDQEGQRIFYQF